LNANRQNDEDNKSTRRAERQRDRTDHTAARTRETQAKRKKLRRSETKDGENAQQRMPIKNKHERGPETRTPKRPSQAAVLITKSAARQDAEWNSGRTKRAARKLQRVPAKTTARYRTRDNEEAKSHIEAPAQTQQYIDTEDERER